MYIPAVSWRFDLRLFPAISWAHLSYLEGRFLSAGNIITKFAYKGKALLTVSIFCRLSTHPIHVRGRRCTTYSEVQGLGVGQCLSWCTLSGLAPEECNGVWWANNAEQASLCPAHDYPIDRLPFSHAPASRDRTRDVGSWRCNLLMTHLPTHRFSSISKCSISKPRPRSCSVW